MQAHDLHAAMVGFDPMVKVSFSEHLRHSRVRKTCNHRQRTKKRTENTILLLKTKILEGYKLDSFDGEIGGVREFFNAIINIGSQLARGRHQRLAYWQKVLVSPYALVSAIQPLFPAHAYQP